MNDHVTSEALAAYVDGLLSADEKSEMESHFSRCPECLDELVEIAAIVRGRDKIPAHFLKQALGEKNKRHKPVLHMRLVFEVAAAFVAVVFIGYFFLDGNRFWQSEVLSKMPSPGSKSDRFSAQAGNGGNIAPMSPAEAEQNREKQDKPGTGAAQPTALQEEKIQGETSQLRAYAAVSQNAGTGRPASEDKKQDVALARKEIAGKRIMPLIHIEGEVGLGDLRNPELLFAWSWLPKGLTLELQIDGAGAVITVVPLGKMDPLAAKQAENEIKKLLFSVSEKKSRRARLVAD
jgi:hypothetical protein